MLAGLRYMRGLFSTPYNVSRGWWARTTHGHICDVFAEVAAAWNLVGAAYRIAGHDGDEFATEMLEALKAAGCEDVQLYTNDHDWGDVVALVERAIDARKAAA